MSHTSRKNVGSVHFSTTALNNTGHRTSTTSTTHVLNAPASFSGRKRAGSHVSSKHSSSSRRSSMAFSLLVDEGDRGGTDGGAVSGSAGPHAFDDDDARRESLYGSSTTSTSSASVVGANGSGTGGLGAGFHHHRHSSVAGSQSAMELAFVNQQIKATQASLDAELATIREQLSRVDENDRSLAVLNNTVSTLRSKAGGELDDINLKIKRAEEQLAGLERDQAALDTTVGDRERKYRKRQVATALQQAALTQNFATPVKVLDSEEDEYLMAHEQEGLSTSQITSGGLSFMDTGASTVSRGGAPVAVSNQRNNASNAVSVPPGAWTPNGPLSRVTTPRQREDGGSRRSRRHSLLAKPPAAPESTAMAAEALKLTNAPSTLDASLSGWVPVGNINSTIAVGLGVGGLPVIEGSSRAVGVGGTDQGTTTEGGLRSLQHSQAAASYSSDVRLLSKPPSTRRPSTSTSTVASPPSPPPFPLSSRGGQDSLNSTTMGFEEQDEEGKRNVGAAPAAAVGVVADSVDDYLLQMNVHLGNLGSRAHIPVAPPTVVANSSAREEQESLKRKKDRRKQAALRAMGPVAEKKLEGKKFV